ncbi:MAG: CadD family cadmium resistance transporter [Anaerolineaceae bacterium]
MGATILSALAVFISTSIDYVLILTIIFVQTRTKKGILHVVGGQYLGTAVLVVASLLIAFILHFIPEEWIIGLLGIIPIILGVRVATQKERDKEEDEAEEVNKKLETAKANRLFWTITLITIASGGDNLGIYIPYFASLAGSDFFIILLVFLIATAILCYIGYKLSTIRLISETLEKYERIIVPIVYIALGIYIMAESGTFTKLISLF